MSNEKMKEGTEWKNKWNRKSYMIVGFEGREVTIERADKSRFKIEIMEFKRNYEPQSKRDIK